MQLLDKRIEDYRRPKVVEPPKAVIKANHRNLDPKFKREILEIFSDVWYDFDEDQGQVKMTQYKQIMRFVQKYKRIPNKPNGPFSDEKLERAFHIEDETSYSASDKVDG